MTMSSTTAMSWRLIPPVSGGGQPRFRVQSEALDPRFTESLVAHPGAGAIVTFIGTVRDHGRGQAVTHLEYEAYAPAAELTMAQIGDEIRERWGIDHVAIVHRVGSLAVGEASVVISVASAHRDAAFEACRYAIERIKEIVPIWKKEHYADGAAWLGSEHDYQVEIGRIPGGRPARTCRIVQSPDRLLLNLIKNSRIPRDDSFRAHVSRNVGPS